MVVPVSRRRFLRLSAFGALSIGTTGCGTLLYPERIGQPRGGPLDWKVVALDTLGLLLFVVPGVIAFVVDFYNGTIFLPTAYYPQAAASDSNSDFHRIEVPRDELNTARIEREVSHRVDRDVRLVAGTYHTHKLQTLDEYKQARERLAAQAS